VGVGTTAIVPETKIQERKIPETKILDPKIPDTSIPDKKKGNVEGLAMKVF
jgi:hypothetical protein